MDAKMDSAAREAYKPVEFTQDPDLEAQARALGVAYDKNTGSILTNVRFDGELEKYRSMLDTVGLPKDIRPEEHYSLGEKVQVALAKWWNKPESEGYISSKARVDEGVKRRVAKQEKKSRIREINQSVSYFEELVGQCEETVRKYRSEINSVNKKKYVSQAKQAEEDRMYRSIDQNLRQIAQDYQKKQARFDAGDSSVDYKELVEAEMQLNALVTDREEALAARDHYTLIVKSCNQKIKLRDTAVNIASAAKTTHYETLGNLKEKRDKLESDEYDLIKVFGTPEKIASAKEAAFKAVVMAEQADKAMEAGWEVAKSMHGIEAGGAAGSEDYTAMAKEAKVRREKKSDEEFRRSREMSKSLLTSRIETILAEEPSDVFGKKDDEGKEPGSEAA